MEPDFADMENALAPDASAFAPVPHAATMGNIKKMRYTHTDLIDYIIANPWASQNELAARYGYTPSWLSNIMASDAWQAAMASRRDEVVDPALKASLEERFKGVVIQSLNRLQEKLNAPQVSDQVVLRAVELGARACGMGGRAAPTEGAPAPVINIFNSTTLADYANRKLADYNSTLVVDQS
jgi:hypothetical protein